MSKILISTTETYRLDNESEVTEALAYMKSNPEYQLQTYTSKIKTLSAKGEIIDSWYNLTVKKVFNNEKEPDMGGYTIGLGDSENESI